VTWGPTWELEELKDTQCCPTSFECIQEFEKRVDEPDLFLPTAVQSLDNLKDKALTTRPTPGPGFKNWTLIYGIKSPLMSTSQTHK